MNVGYYNWGIGKNLSNSPVYLSFLEQKGDWKKNHSQFGSLKIEKLPGTPLLLSLLSSLISKLH